MSGRSKSSALPGLALLLSFAGLAGLVLTGVPAAIAHGVGYRESELWAIPLEFFYSTGESMSYLETMVYAPKDAAFEYQSGRTDEDGRFAFTPNAAGEWRVVVKDDEGHRAEAKVEVTTDYLEGGGAGASAGVSGKAAAPRGLDLYLRAGLGVSLLFNAAAFLSLARARKAA